MKKLIYAVMILMFSAAVLSAQTVTPQIKKTQKHQQARIHQGVKTGELTKGEVKKLEHEQKKIQRDKKIAKSDGIVTPVERKHIRNEQNKANRDIYKLKHNNKTK